MNATSWSISNHGKPAPVRRQRVGREQHESAVGGVGQADRRPQQPAAGETASASGSSTCPRSRSSSGASAETTKPPARDQGTEDAAELAEPRRGARRTAARSSSANDADDSVLVFKETTTGMWRRLASSRARARPSRTRPGSPFDAKNNELWVTSMGNYTITVFPVTASGNATPLRVIRGGPAASHSADDWQPGRRRVRQEARRTAGPELSGPSADCGICQAGKWRNATDETNLRTGVQARAGRCTTSGTTM
jgi:hypothetical protein